MTANIKSAGLLHYLGYERRCSLPTNFDATWVLWILKVFWTEFRFPGLALFFGYEGRCSLPTNCAST